MTYSSTTDEDPIMRVKELALTNITFGLFLLLVGLEYYSYVAVIQVVILSMAVSVFYVITDSILIGLLAGLAVGAVLGFATYKVEKIQHGLLIISSGLAGGKIIAALTLQEWFFFG